MLEISGPQLKPFAELLLKFDKIGRVHEIWNINWPANRSGVIVLSYQHRTYDERYFISRSGNVERKDVMF